MTVNRRLYPPKSVWSVMRQEALERVQPRPAALTGPHLTLAWASKYPAMPQSRWAAMLGSVSRLAGTQRRLPE